MILIEEDQRITGNKSISPSYRVTISVQDHEITIKREYFYYGFYEHTEDFDNFWFNSNSNSKYNDLTDIYKGSFITRKLNDPEYLKLKEQELIETFYSNLIKNEQNLKIELDKKIKKYNDRINECQINQNCDLFIKLKRKEKLKKIKNN